MTTKGYKKHKLDYKILTVNSHKKQAFTKKSNNKISLFSMNHSRIEQIEHKLTVIPTNGQKSKATHAE